MMFRGPVLFENLPGTFPRYAERIAKLFQSHLRISIPNSEHFGTIFARPAAARLARRAAPASWNACSFAEAVYQLCFDAMLFRDRPIDIRPNVADKGNPAFQLCDVFFAGHGASASNTAKV